MVFVLCIFLVFSPIGIYFASCSHDNTARLWSSDTVYPLRVFVGHLSGVDVSKPALVVFNLVILVYIYTYVGVLFPSKWELLSNGIM